MSAGMESVSTLLRIDVDGRAVASARQDAVLVLAQVGELNHQPDADDRQHDRKAERSEIDHHAVAIVVVVVPAFVLPEVRDRRRRRLRRAGVPRPAVSTRAAAPGTERHDPVVIVGAV